MPEQIPPASTELLDDLIFAALANPSSDEPIYDAICRHRALTSSTS